MLNQKIVDPGEKNFDKMLKKLKAFLKIKDGKPLSDADRFHFSMKAEDLKKITKDPESIKQFIVIDGVETDPEAVKATNAADEEMHKGDYSGDFSAGSNIDLRGYEDRAEEYRKITDQKIEEDKAFLNMNSEFERAVHTIEDIWVIDVEGKSNTTEELIRLAPDSTKDADKDKPK